MKTRTGSGIDGEWDDESYAADEPVYEREEASALLSVDDAVTDVPVDDDKSDPYTDGLDDEPIEDIEPGVFSEDDVDGEPEDESAEETEGSDISCSAEQMQHQEELPLFEKYFIDEPAEKQKALDLTDSHDTLGQRLIKYRKTAGLSLDQVFARTRIVQDYLTNLESGNYSELTGKIYARRNITLLCQCYGLDDSIKEELHELLTKEYEESGFCGHDVILPNSGNPQAGIESRGSNLLAKLPGIIIMFLLVVVIIMIVLAMIVPLLNKSRTHVVRPVDMAPLVVPDEWRPRILKVPK